MIGIADIAKIRRRVFDYGLLGSDRLLKYSDAELQGIYNGVGPDRWPEAVRRLLTGLAGLYEPAVMVHDVEFRESDGLVDSFKDTVEHFRANVKIIQKAEWPIWTWAMLRPSYRVGRAAAVALGVALAMAVSGDRAYEIYKAEATE
jgi:hypothetical protein